MSLATFPLLIVMLLTGGTGNELLDFVHAPSYWQIKGVAITTDSMVAQLQAQAPVDTTALPKLIDTLGDASFDVRENATKQIQAMGRPAMALLQNATKIPDPEIAERATKLLAGMGPDLSNDPILRLMAIRTLGDLEAAPALPVLQKLLDSDAMFEADYAARAIAAINGKPLPSRGIDQAVLDADLAILPAETGLAVQARFPAGKRLDFDAIMAGMGPMMGGVMGGAANPNQILLDMTKGLLQVAEKTGNIRLDAGTGGLSREVGDNAGSFVALLRGQYDRARIEKALKDLNIEGLERGKFRLYAPEDEFAIMPVSDHQIVLVMGADRNLLPIDHVVKTLGAEPAKSVLKEDLRAAMKDADRSAAMWLAAVVTPSYRSLEPLAAFDSLAFTSVQEDGSVKIAGLGRGQDADAIQASVQKLEASLQKNIPQVEQMAQQMPASKPMVAFMKSITFAVDGQTATVKANLEGDMSALSIMPMMLFGFRSQAHNRAAAARAGEVQAVEVEQP